MCKSFSRNDPHSYIGHGENPSPVGLNIGTSGWVDEVGAQLSLERVNILAVDHT